MEGALEPLASKAVTGALFAFQIHASIIGDKAKSAVILGSILPYLAGRQMRDR